MQLQFTWQSTCPPSRLLRVRDSSAAPRLRFIKLVAFASHLTRDVLHSFLFHLLFPALRQSLLKQQVFVSGFHTSLDLMRHRQAVRQGTLTPPSQVRLLLAQLNMLEQLSWPERLICNQQALVDLAVSNPVSSSISSIISNHFNSLLFKKKIIEVGIQVPTSIHLSVHR